jgi:hypothetical protein
MPVLTYSSGILGPVVNSLALGFVAGAGVTENFYAARLVPDGSLDLTAQLAAPAGTGLQFANTGREVLLILPGAGAETVTVGIGMLVLGQPVNSFAPVAMIPGHLYAFGPFHRQADEQGTNIMQVTVSTTSSIQVAVIQMAGVY